MPTQNEIANGWKSPRVGRLILWGLILVMIAFNARLLVPATEPASQGAADFSIFYAGANMVRSGWSHQLYNLHSQARFHSAYYRSHPLPYNHPAYELLLFLPLVALSFSSAYYTWMCLNVGILFLIAAVLSKGFEITLLSNPGFIFSAALAFLPVCVCLLQGQDSLLLVFIYSATYLAMKKRRDFAAGLLLSLGLFKFTLVLPFVIPFLVQRYWKLLAGFVLGAGSLAVVSLAITGVTGSLEYIALMRLLLERPEIGYITPSLMPNLRGLMTSIASSKSSVEGVVAALSIVVIAFTAVIVVRPAVRDQRFDLAFALNITSVVLTSYHLYVHDSSLLLLALLLAASVLLNSRASVQVKLLFWLSISVLFCTPLYDLGLMRASLGIMALPVVALFGLLSNSLLKKELLIADLAASSGRAVH